MIITPSLMLPEIRLPAPCTVPPMVLALRHVVDAIEVVAPRPGPGRVEPDEIPLDEVEVGGRIEHRDPVLQVARDHVPRRGDRPADRVPGRVGVESDHLSPSLPSPCIVPSILLIIEPTESPEGSRPMMFPWTTLPVEEVNPSPESSLPRMRLPCAPAAVPHNPRVARVEAEGDAVPDVPQVLGARSVGPDVVALDRLAGRLVDLDAVVPIRRDDVAGRLRGAADGDTPRVEDVDAAAAVGRPTSRLPVESVPMRVADDDLVVGVGPGQRGGVDVAAR